MDRSVTQKIKREIRELTDIMTQMELTDIYRTFHPNTEYTFFSAAHGTISKIDHILGHKTNLNRYKKGGITPCILSDQHGKKLEFNNTNYRKPTNPWKLNNSQLNYHWIKKERNERFRRIQ